MKAANAHIVRKKAAYDIFNSVDDETMERKKKSLVQFFESRLQMDRLTAIRTIAQHPSLVLSSHDLERKLDWLTRQGIDAKALHTIVQRFPQILQHSEEALEGTKQWLLDQGIAPSKIPFILLMAPNVAAFSHKNLDHKVEYLRGVGLDDDQIRRVLEHFPNVLLMTVENLASKVESARSLGLSDDEVVKLVTLVPQFLGLNIDTIQCKLQALDELLGEGEALRLWLSNPPLIGLNTEEFRRTFEYLTKVVGMTPDRISQNVMFITRNVDRIVRPRFEYLTKIQARDLNTVNWIKLSETKFVSRHPAYVDFLAREFKP